MDSEKTYYKYPRTPHLPWSPGVSDDDVIVDAVDSFVGKEVVVTEKMDGENTTMYNDHIHSRSLTMSYHPSRTWVQNLHGKIRFNLGDEARICGENMFWVHSIVYTSLPSYFIMFSYWKGEQCFSWDDTVELAGKLGLDMAPVLYRGVFDEDIIKSLWDESKQGTMEGYVVRLADAYTRNNFTESVAKFVRKDHVQTDQHWMRSGGELNMLQIKK